MVWDLRTYIHIGLSVEVTMPNSVPVLCVYGPLLPHMSAPLLHRKRDFFRKPDSLSPRPVEQNWMSWCCSRTLPFENLGFLEFDDWKFIGVATIRLDSLFGCEGFGDEHEYGFTGSRLSVSWLFELISIDLCGTIAPMLPKPFRCLGMRQLVLCVHTS